MTSGAGTVTGAVAWARRQLGASAPKVERWNSQAPGEWCGVWMAALMRAMGLRPPAGYQAAHSWSGFGTEVKPGEEKPGDVLVYGYQHVGFYVGNGEMISGNWSGTVGAAKVPASIKGTPLTAIRRPPYKDRPGEGHIPSFAEESGNSGLGLPGEKLFEEKIGQPGNNAIETVAETVKKGADLTKSVVGALEDPAPVVLTIGLVIGGAGLALFGIARMFGVDHPVKTPVAAIGKAAAIPAEAA